MAATKLQERHFENELVHNPSLYVDQTCNMVNLTILAESFIDEHQPANKEQVYESAIDWFKGWRGNVRYHNN